MKSDELLDAIGDAKYEYVYDARTARKQKKPRWGKWISAIAACLVLALGVNFFLHLGANQGVGSGDGTLTYMYYTGPVLPLTLEKENSPVTASRNVDFDFSPYEPYQESYEDSKGELVYYTGYNSQSNITDTYLLENTSGTDQTVTALYPFVGTLRETEYHPTVTVSGETVAATLHPGPYAGSFMGVWGSGQEETGSANLLPLESFDSYETLLADDVYQASAFDPFPALDIPVTVYRMSDYVYTTDESATNPTLAFQCYIDSEKTQVLCYGINSFRWDPDTGFRSYGNSAIEYRPDVDPEYQHPEEAYIIVIGADIDGYTLQGYRDGGCDEGEEVDDLGCTITRYETTLADILMQFIMEWSPEDPEMLFNAAAELLVTHGSLGEEVKERYDNNMLEDILSESHSHTRVMYLRFEITIPAGVRVTVEAEMVKDASINYYGDGTDRDAYDMATALGTNLTFTEQTASISGYTEIEIVRQNLGFDLQNGITHVALDLNEPHYWIEVRKAE